MIMKFKKSLLGIQKALDGKSSLPARRILEKAVKKPIYKKWWFWGLAIAGVAAAAGGGGGGGSSAPTYVPPPAPADPPTDLDPGAGAPAI